MRIMIFTGTNQLEVSKLVNESIEELEAQGNRIKDVKLSCDQTFNILVMYEKAPVPGVQTTLFAEAKKETNGKPLCRKPFWKLDKEVRKFYIALKAEFGFDWIDVRDPEYKKIRKGPSPANTTNSFRTMEKRGALEIRDHKSGGKTYIDQVRINF